MNNRKIVVRSRLLAWLTKRGFRREKVERSVRTYQHVCGWTGRLSLRMPACSLLEKRAGKTERFRRTHGLNPTQRESPIGLTEGSPKTRQVRPIPRFRRRAPPPLSPMDTER